VVYLDGHRPSKYTRFSFNYASPIFINGEKMATITSKDGTKIAYDRQGQGPAMLLIDGAMCYRASGPMGPLAAQLKDQFTVYTYDRRGRGDSSDTMPYAVECEIEDIAGLIDEAGGSAFVYGISSGAVLALRAAARLGNKVTKLALYEPPFTSGEAAQKAAKAYTQQLIALLAQGKRGEAVALFMQRVGLPDEAIAGMRQAPSWPAMEALAPTLAYDDAVMDDGSLPGEAAKAADQPALVMDGGDSPAFMQAAAQALAKAMPHAKLLTLEGQTHDVKPEVLGPVLARFFQV
jgi:pimeloyl-ACP methyl ester carboxylesterase